MSPDVAPDLSLDSTAGMRRLRPPDGRMLLLLIYQEDATPTCTTLLCSFRDEAAVLADLGVDVLGLSPNDLASHESFVERLAGLPFPLASDPQGRVARALGVWEPDTGQAARSVFVIDDHGRIVHSWPHYNPANLDQFEAVFRALGLEA